MDSTTDEAQPSTSQATDIAKIKTLLKAKDDTQRFVGLALLKSVLDGSEELRQDEETVHSLWSSLSPKFLDRLLRTGSKPSNKNAKEMLDLVVSVLHIFSILLPEQAKSDARFIDRTPLLVAAILYSTEETTALILQILHTLVSSQAGAQAFIKIADISSLTEIAPTHAAVLDILSFAWLNSMTVVEDSGALATKVDATIQSLVSSFTGTDAVTLLEFLGYFLRNANPSILPRQPKWLNSVVNYIQNLVTSRPTPEARSAYTNAAASILQTYPIQGPKILFTDAKKDDKAFSYLLINLLLIDIRSSAPTLLEQLNTPEYPKSVEKTDFCIRYHLHFSEYLRDRWDASVVGAMGLHPDARAGTTETSTGTHHTLAWDSIKDNADEDMFILSAVRALALWLREDDNDSLRKETTGLMDMFMDLYQSSSQEKLDFRSPILVALEGVTTMVKGRDSLLANDGWRILTSDLNSILQHGSHACTEEDASRATDIVRILLPIVEQETSGIPEVWMDLITAVAAWDVSDAEQSSPSPMVQEAQVAALQLCCAVLVAANSGMRKRYQYSIAAINGIAAQLGGHVGPDSPVREMLDDVLATLGGLAHEG
ncbi:hypothetical protein CEP52_006652 [Fusarium oligoseptatum]|uniref:DUF1941 family protein n=1 Tax=Fusarium oligoseptatum TaxID=2604345 RepID=A0A428TS12_9HYPO|nr:hypothetical protein CEP52_006652 [Fusarium oligoseptatum]